MYHFFLEVNNWSQSYGVKGLLLYLSFFITSVYVGQVKETIFCTLISLIGSFDKIN